jgi:hypothetical protein
MIDRLLVGLDGSKLAEAVLPYVEQFAQAGRVEVILAWRAGQQLVSIVLIALSENRRS